MTTKEKDLAITVDFEDEKKQKIFSEAMEKLQQDADAMAALEQSTNLKEAYEALKKYCQLTFDEYEQFCNKLMAQLKESTAKLAADRELAEDELDMVTGGWSWGSFWKAVAAVAICAAVVVAGIATGGAVFAGIGAAAAASMGMISVGGTAAVTAICGGAVGGVVAGVCLGESSNPVYYKKLISN